MNISSWDNQFRLQAVSVQATPLVLWYAIEKLHVTDFPQISPTHPPPFYRSVHDASGDIPGYLQTTATRNGATQTHPWLAT